MARQTEKGEVAPTSTAARKQNTDSPQVAKATGEPTPASGRRNRQFHCRRRPPAANHRNNRAPQVGASANKIPGKKTNATHSATWSPMWRMWRRIVRQPKRPTSIRSNRRRRFVRKAACGRRCRRDAQPNAARRTATQFVQSNRARFAGTSTVSESTAASGSDRRSNASPARASRNAEVAATPINVESPAVGGRRARNRGTHFRAARANGTLEIAGRSRGGGTIGEPRSSHPGGG